MRRVRGARARKTPKKREARLAHSRKSISVARARTADEARASQERHTQAKRDACARETPQATLARQEAQRQEMEIARIPDQERARQVTDPDATDLSRRFFPSNGRRCCALGEMDVECRNCGALHFLAERKVGISGTNPAFSNCCQGGKLTTEHMPLLQDPPHILQELLTQDTSEASGNIVRYNRALSMASVHANWVHRVEGNS